MIFRIIFPLLLITSLQAQALPQGATDLFAGSGNCAICHAPGGPNPAALLDSEGNDISPATLWRSSMMAHSARDPLWQAKVQAEIWIHPHLQELIEDKCSTCHAPMGRTEAIHDGMEHYTMESMLSDPIAMDGVSCAACHQIQDPLLSEVSTFSGHYVIENSRQIYGPHENPLVTPMQNMMNYTPVYSEHTQKSELCATCHTLFTPYLDDAGEIAGEAPEQVPYLEWQNSVYPELGIECQTCHMPAYDELVGIANRPPWLSERQPFHPHEFAGSNVFMLRLLRQFREEIGVTATDAQMDLSIEKSLEMLQNQTVELVIQNDWVSGDTIQVSVHLENLAGHKFPTAYPSRRAWIELELTDIQGNTLFHSGSWDDQGEILGLDSIYEPHHDQIRDADQVQIYENIPMDINGERSFTLLRIAGYLKDNRLPPRGYSAQGPGSDSTRVEGLAAVDPNFNRSGDTEGTASDDIFYLIGDLSPNQIYTIRVALHFQSISPRFAADLFAYDLPEVTRFQNYYSAMDLAPVTLAEIETSTPSATAIGVDPGILPEQLQLTAYPNPFNPATHIELEIPQEGIVRITVFDLNGAQVDAIDLGHATAGAYGFSWHPNQTTTRSSGVFLARVELKTTDGVSIQTGFLKLVYLK
jgi:hypothetical protein